MLGSLMLRRLRRKRVYLFKGKDLPEDGILLQAHCNGGSSLQSTNLGKMLDILYLYLYFYFAWIYP